jgi:hypothetical protein
MTHLTHNQKVIHGMRAPVCVRWQECNFNYNGGEITVQYNYCDGETELNSVRIGNSEWLASLSDECTTEIENMCAYREESQL